MVVHQGGPLVGFLEGRVNHNVSANVRELHNGRTDHERNVSRTCYRQDRLGIHTSRIRDDRTGRGDRDVRGSIGIEERIAAEIHRKSTVRIAPEHLFKRDLVGNPRFIVSAGPVSKGVQMKTERSFRSARNGRSANFGMPVQVGRNLHVPYTPLESENNQLYKKCKYDTTLC